MIHDFFLTVQQDAMCIGNYIKNWGVQNNNARVDLAAVRMLSALGMLGSGFIAIRAFKATTPNEAIFRLANAVACYILSHDVFVIVINIGQQNFAARLMQVMQAQIAKPPPRNPYTEGTLFWPCWDYIV